MAHRSSAKSVFSDASALLLLSRNPVQTILCKCRVGLLLLGIGLLSRPAAAESITLTPVADATLIEVNPNNSSGGAEFFNAGTTQNHTRNRALIQFDIAASIPTGSAVLSVSLQLSVTRQPVDGFDVSLFGLHRMLRPWGEGVTIPIGNPGGLGAPAMTNDATWLHRFAHTGQSWAAPGGEPGIDFVPAFSSATLIFGVGDPYVFEGASAFAADVQFWLDHPDQNFGWMLLAQSEELPFTARRFASRESSSPPLLFVEFEPVPEPRTMLLASLALLIFTGFNRNFAQRMLQQAL